MITVKTNMATVITRLNGKISSFLPGAQHYDGLLREVATSMIAVVKTRIHEQGKAADDTAIGQYSSKPTYISLSESPKAFVAKGKNSKQTVKVKYSDVETRKEKSKKMGALKNGRLRTSGYFKGGYNEFKTEIGRNQLGSVNLSLTGQLNSQLTVQPTAKGYGYGWPDEEKLKRAKALEKKYNKQIWALTDEEKQQVIVICENYVKRALSE